MDYFIMCQKRQLKLQQCIKLLVELIRKSIKQLLLKLKKWSLLLNFISTMGKGSIRAFEALRKMDEIECNIKMLSDHDSESVVLIKNIPIALPESMASTGVWSMSISDSDEDNVKALVYMPANSHIYPHFHDNLIEHITIQKGNLNYKLYESDKHSKIINEGVLKENDKLLIEKDQTHYLFTCVEEVYSWVIFYKQ